MKLGIGIRLNYEELKGSYIYEKERVIEDC